MEVSSARRTAYGIRFSVTENGVEAGRAYLYVMTNDLHDEPFGLLEDVFVDEAARGKGYGSALVTAVIEEARRRGCYKLIATSRHARPKVHPMYRRLGFEEQGLEFRLNFV